MSVNICTYESRPEDFVALKLLVLSVGRHMPGARVHIPLASIDGARADWLGRQPNVVTHDDITPLATGWDVKASILMALLQKGVDPVTWLDADIVVLSDLSKRLEGLDNGTVLVAQEAFRSRNTGTAARARGHGFQPGPERGFTVNSCVLRVSGAHLSLLGQWQGILTSDTYQRAQAQDWFERPFYMFGDQDVLGALLGAQNYADVRLDSLAAGYDVAHSYLISDYGLPERLAALGGRHPLMAHAQRFKLWQTGRGAGKLDAALHPYRLAAIPYRNDLAPDERAWLSGDPLAARLARRMTRDHPGLAGLPLGAVGSARRVAYRAKHALERMGILRSSAARGPQPAAVDVAANARARR